MLHIIEKRRYTYAFSLLCIFASIFAISVWGLKLGRDFTGGALLEYKIANDKGFTREMLCDKIDGGCPEDVTAVQISADDQMTVFQIQYKQAEDAFNQKIITAIETIDENATQEKVEFTGAVISQQTQSNAFKAIFFAIIAILLYIAWAFRNISVPVSSWYYGVGAVIALAHDIIITIGAFAFLGHFFGVTVELPFIAALLTILGYSVNDTIVVYDRVRENVLKSRALGSFDELVNISLNETLARSINTSLTVIIVLVAMVLFGGTSLFSFSLALLIGIMFGTYSSIFVASVLIVTIYNMQKNAQK